MKTTSLELPQEVVKGNHLGQPQYTINFNIEEKPEEGYPEYVYYSVVLPPGKFDYDTIVSALVNEIYPSDKMQAVVNNYLADPEDVDIKKEFEEMQNWRAKAKEIAKRLLKEKD